MISLECISLNDLDSSWEPKYLDLGSEVIFCQMVLESKNAKDDEDCSSKM